MASFYVRRDGVAAPFGVCHILAGMDFAMPAKTQHYHERLSAFMTDFVFPAEAEYDCHRIEAGPNDHTLPPIVEER
jgi:acyl-CoA dehydrogenase